MPDAAVPMTAAAIAALVNGRLAGDGSLPITAAGPLDRAHGGALSFLTSARYLDEFTRSAAGAVLVPEQLALPLDGPRVRIAVADPSAAMMVALRALFAEPAPTAGIASTAVLGRGVRLGREVTIAAYATIGDDCVLGDRVRIGPGAVLEAGVVVGAESDLGAHVVCHRRTRIGQRARIKAGAVLGGTGFGYASDRAGHHLIPHVGGCVVGDDVHIGANTCIDRGSLDDTEIGTGCRIDNQVHIGHNARLGNRCLVMGGAVVAGSARIGNDVILAGHSAVGGHFTVGDRVRVGAKSGVISEVPAGTDVSGFPARPHREFLRAQAALYRLVPIIDSLEDMVTRSGGE
ncbi:MAG: UDP-3-O-(3-hydroxymyristoyl)glucosamine N-acyltransferase [Gemmatimonadetes bacterium]|nr:UDP-3-O-(3-hydroxymyristoyl)glucosamine N-acyltransferase [Gemmatimonadota bacterium]